MIDKFNSINQCSLVALLTVVGCTVAPEIEINDARITESDSPNGVLVLTISASEDLRSSAESKHIDAFALLHICGLEAKFRTVSYLREARNDPTQEFAYDFEFPSTIEGQVISRGSGKLEQGWPKEILRNRNVCVQIRGANMSGTRFRSNMVELPQVKQILLP